MSTFLECFVFLKFVLHPILFFACVLANGCFLFRHIPDRLDSFKPDLVVYNAGTDILIGDPLGNLDITPEVCRWTSFTEDYCILLRYTDVHAYRV